MATMIRNVRFAIRTMRRSPGFAALVVLTLTVGIAANVAIFAVVNALLLRSLTFADPDRLVMLWESNAERGWQRVEAAPANAFDWRDRVSAFTDVALLNGWEGSAALTGRGEPVNVQIGTVSGNLFSVLGARPVLGRAFTLDETWASAQPVAMLSHASWQRQFGADPGVIGSVAMLDGLGYEVVGVMPAGFRYAFNEAEIWMPFRWTAERRESVWFRQAHVVRAVARLAPGATVERARAELETVARQLQREHPRLNRMMDAGLTPLHAFLVGDRRLALLLVMAAVGLLQLIACANVANVMLTRAVGRRDEMAVRTALGAGRLQIAAQLLTESALLAGAGALLGVGLGTALVRWAATQPLPGLPPLSLQIDWRVLTFTLALAVASALVFGVAPIVRLFREELTAGLRGGGRGGSTSREQQRTVGAFTALQVALALMLVVGAGLMVRTLIELSRVDSGVRPHSILTFVISPPSGAYPTDTARADFLIRLLDRLRGIPGVEEAAATRALALEGGGWTSDFSIEGWPPDRYGLDVRHREVTPGYFRALGVPVMAGTLFPERLGSGEPSPVVVNQAFAQRYFPDDSPIGHRVAFDREPDASSHWYRIVGVVGNVRQRVAYPVEPEIIAHLSSDTPGRPWIAVKTTVEPLSLVATVRGAVAELDPNIPLIDVGTMETVLGRATARERILVDLLGIFAALALGLACVGVYGVAAQAAAARTREIGIRMALGASRSAIVRGLLLHTGPVVAVGVVAGLGAAIVATRFMAGLLFGVRPTDPATFIAVAVLLAAVAFVSSYLPARRATTVDPISVLRAE